MRKLILILAIFAVVAAVAIGIFISTFDINTYKGTIVSRLESLTGSPVAIGRLSLEWKGRLLLGVEGLKIYAEEEGHRISALSFDRAQAAVELVPLLNRKLEVSSISVERPQMTVIRSKDGKIGILGIGPNEGAAPSSQVEPAVSPPPSPHQGSVTTASAALNFNIKTVEIRNGLLRFIDLSTSSPADIVIKMLDASVQNVSLEGPVRFAARMAISADRQNLELSGIAGGWGRSAKDSINGGIFLKDFALEADLSLLKHSEVIDALPILEKIGLGSGLAGILKAKVRSLQMSGNKVSEVSADLSFTQGKLSLVRLKVPIDRIELIASAEGQTVTLKSFSAQLANGTLKGAARIDDAFNAPKTDLDLVAEAQGLNRFLSSVFAFYLNLDGGARIDFKGSMTGSAWPEISTSLRGSGTISLEKGVISNSNVVNDTLGALTLFPDLVNSVRNNVPPPVRDVMVEKYTLLKPFKQSFNLEGGYIIVPDLILTSQDMDMRGTGKISLTGDLSGDVMMRFSPAISSAIIAAVPQMRAIADPQGLIMFPMAFKGGSEGFKVIPDMKYIGQRIAVQAAGDAVSGYLQKVMEKTNGTPGTTAEGGEVKAPKLKDILKALSD